MFWEKTKIIKALNSEYLSIKPFCKHCIKSYSYILRLGKTWNHIPQGQPLAEEIDVFDLSLFRSKVKTNLASSILIKSFSFILNASCEVVRLPSNVMGIMLPLGQITRLGFVNFSSPFLHPGFGGDTGLPIVFEFYHILPYSIRLYAGMPFAHLHFLSVTPSRDSHDSPARTYLDNNFLGSIYDQLEAYQMATEEFRGDSQTALSE